MIWLKHLHMLLAVVSVTGFVVRGLFLALNSDLMQRKWIKIVPHIIDTFLLVTGIALAMMWSSGTLITWLPYKLGALLAYIVLGMLAFRLNQSAALRCIYGFSALFAVLYLFGIARYKTPLSWGILW